VSGAAAPTSPEEIRSAQQELGREMVRRRKDLRYSQTQLARKVNHARGTLHACETGNRTLGSHELWQEIDDALGADGALVRQRDQIAARAAAAADAAERAGMRAPGGRPPDGTVPGGAGDPITAVRDCPSCGTSLVFRMYVLAVRVPDQLVAASALTRAACPAGPAAARARQQPVRPVRGRFRPAPQCRSSRRLPGCLPVLRADRPRRRTGPRTGSRRRL
jgi:DNA-binding XRE family transcriptional regulator